MRILQAFAESACRHTLRLPPGPDGESSLRAATDVEVSLISDKEIARIHAEFMGIEGATDVITFHHGEILVSADTASARAGEFGHSVARETALYIAHGLLHLHAYDDKDPAAAERMRILQEKVLAACWAGSWDAWQ